MKNLQVGGYKRTSRKYNCIIIPLLAVLLLVLVGTVGATTWADDFAADTSANYTYDAGVYSWNTGNSELIGDPTVWGWNHLTYTDYIQSYGTYTINFNLPTGFGWVLLKFGSNNSADSGQTGANCYRILIKNTTYTELALQRMTNGTASTLSATESVPSLGTGSHNLTAVWNASHIVVYFDTTKYLEPAETTYTSGYAGAIIQGNGAGDYPVNISSFKINAETPPTAVYTANVSGGHAPLKVQFTDASYPNITGWSWYFWDNETVSSTDQNPVANFSTGNYKVRLKVTTGTLTDWENSTGNITAGSKVVVLVGDSITKGATHTYGGLNGYSGYIRDDQPNWYIFNDGVGSTDINNASSRYAVTVEPLEPDYLILAHPSWSEDYEEEVAQLHAYIDMVEANGTTVYLNTIPPRAQTWAQRQMWMQYNDWIRYNYTPSHSSRYYIDFDVLMKANETNLKDEYSLDGTHINGAGYAAWGQAIDTSFPGMEPATITNLLNDTPTCDAMTFSYTRPGDSDFLRVKVWRNNTEIDALPNSSTSTTWTGLPNSTEMTISTKTEDLAGNINDTWVNKTAITADFCELPPTPTQTSNASRAISNKMADIQGFTVVGVYIMVAAVVTSMVATSLFGKK